MKITEGRFLVYSLLSIVLLMMFHLFQSQIMSFYNPANYVGFHTMLESFSISISAAIFLYALKSFGKNQSSRMLLLSFTFFLVGTLDLLHTLSFKGMPYFFTESSVAKATWFWVSARVSQSILILTILLIPDKKLDRDYRLFTLLIGLVISAIIGFVIIFYENSLPLLMVEGKGTTSLKNSIEYGVSFIQLISLMIALYQYHMEKREATLAIALAFVYLLLTELIFTIYQSVFDMDNFAGHIFKALGFYFILKSFYFSNQELKANEQEEQTKLLGEVPGFIFQAVKKGNDYLVTFGDGDYLKERGLINDQVVGQPLSKVFPNEKTIIEQYCQLATRLQERIAFEIDVLDKTFLVSIKPIYDSEENESIMGTVIDVSHTEPEQRINPHMNEEKKSVQIVM